MLIVYIISMLKVTGEVCGVGVVRYREHSHTASQRKMTVQRCFVLLFITFVFFPSLFSAFFSSSKLLLMLRFGVIMLVYAIMLKGQYVV